jgi:hypothetical protein
LATTYSLLETALRKRMILPARKMHNMPIWILKRIASGTSGLSKPKRITKDATTITDVTALMPVKTCSSFLSL